MTTETDASELTDREPVAVAVDPAPSRVRWGAVWAGAVVITPTFATLQLLAYAFSVPDSSGTSGPSVAAGGVVTAVLALVVFLVGGLTAGAAGGRGFLHGVLTWALATTALLVVGLLGGGAVFSQAAVAATEMSAIARQSTAAGPMLDAARDLAGWAALGLGLSLAAAVVGGVVGAAVRPRSRTTVGSRL